MFSLLSNNISESLEWKEGNVKMCDREARDMARKEKKGTPTPKKLPSIHKSSDNKENEGKTCKARLNFPKDDDTNEKVLEEKEEDAPPVSDNRTSFDHPVYKIDWIYLGPIITCSILTVLNLVFLCMIARAFKRVNPNAVLFL